MPRDAVIDLDLLPAEPPTPAALAPRNRRFLLVAGVCVATLLLLAGAAQPRIRAAAPALRLLLAEEATYQIAGDTCYVAEPQPEGARITAYPLAGGRPRWSVRLEAMPGGLTMSVLGDVVLVGALLSEPLVSAHVTALDRGTGAVRWHSTLWPDQLDPDRGVVVLDNPVQVDRIDAMPDGDVVAMVAATGQPRWTYHWAAGCQISVPEPTPDDRAALAVLCGDGTLTAVDLVTGKVRATVHDAFRVPSGDLDFGIRIAALPDAITVIYPGASGSILASFDPRDLTERWRAPVPALYPPSSCGAWLCLFNSDGTSVVDPRTGQVVWHLPRGGYVAGFTARYLVVVDATADASILDAGDFRTLLTTAGWSPDFSETHRTVLLRRDERSRRTWVAMLDPDPLGVRLLGWLPALTDPRSCMSAGDYIACRTVNQMVIWRLARPA